MAEAGDNQGDDSRDESTAGEEAPPSADESSPEATGAADDAAEPYDYDDGYGDDAEGGSAEGAPPLARGERTGGFDHEEDPGEQAALSADPHADPYNAEGYNEYDDYGQTDSSEDPWREDQQHWDYPEEHAGEEELEETEEEEEEEEEEEADEVARHKMTLVEHLDELRMRLIRMALGLAAGVGLSLAFGNYIVDLIKEPFIKVAGENSLIAIGSPDSFMMYLKICLYAGIVISSPWLFYQLWMFVSAGLYRHERRYVTLSVPFSAILFITGALFFLKVIALPILKFFYVFGEKYLGIKQLITFENHVTFMTNMMLVFGLCFQTPIAVLLLVKIGIVEIKTLRRFRKHVIVAMLILAAFCTSPSPLDQIALAIPMWMLYELGILLAYFLVERPRKKEEEAEAAMASND